MSKSAALKAACLTAGLATAWAAPAAKGSTDVFVSATASPLYTSSLTFSHLTSVGGFLSISGTLTFAIPDDTDGSSELRSTSGSTLLSWAGTLQLGAADDIATQPWEVVGLVSSADGSLNNDLFVALPSPPGSQDFSTLFPKEDESAIVASLVRKDSQTAATIEEFLSHLTVPPNTLRPGAAMELYAFSPGVDIGSFTFSVTAVPEPGTLALATLAFLPLLRRRRLQGNATVEQR